MRKCHYRSKLVQVTLAWKQIFWSQFQHMYFGTINLGTLKSRCMTHKTEQTLRKILGSPGNPITTVREEITHKLFFTDPLALPT